MCQTPAEKTPHQRPSNSPQPDVSREPGVWHREGSEGLLLLVFSSSPLCQRPVPLHSSYLLGDRLSCSLKSGQQKKFPSVYNPGFCRGRTLLGGNPSVLCSTLVGSTKVDPGLGVTAGERRSQVVLPRRTERKQVSQQGGAFWKSSSSQREKRSPLRPMKSGEDFGLLRGMKGDVEPPVPHLKRAGMPLIFRLQEHSSLKVTRNLCQTFFPF